MTCALCHSRLAVPAQAAREIAAALNGLTRAQAGRALVEAAFLVGAEEREGKYAQ